MRYWDASALVPLCVQEQTSEAMRALAAGSLPIVTWALSRLEIASAMERRCREQSLSQQGRASALQNLNDLAASWIEIRALEAVALRGARLLATHPLRAAGATQLAAALTAVGDQSAGHEFVCLDHRLADAAAREGFLVLQEKVAP